MEESAVDGLLPVRDTAVQLARISQRNHRRGPVGPAHDEGQAAACWARHPPFWRAPGRRILEAGERDQAGALGQGPTQLLPAGGRGWGRADGAEEGRAALERVDLVLGFPQRGLAFSQRALVAVDQRGEAFAGRDELAPAAPMLGSDLTPGRGRTQRHLVEDEVARARQGLEGRPARGLTGPWPGGQSQEHVAAGVAALHVRQGLELSEEAHRLDDVSPEELGGGPRECLARARVSAGQGQTALQREHVRA